MATGSTADTADDGRPTWYVVAGTLAALVSLLLFVPVAGLVAIYCGVRVHAAGERVFAYVLGVGGAIPVVLWLAGTIG